MTSPLYFVWTEDGVMRPVNPRSAARLYEVGQSYRLGVIEERSTNTHNHYFASLTEAWKNLPEHYAERFPSVEHLRKWCLVKAGYADERSIACASPEEAAKVGAFVRPLDDFAVITVRDNVVKVYTAKSQSTRSMDKKEFGESKIAVLDICAQMVGVTPEQLQKEAGKAA